MAGCATCQKPLTLDVHDEEEEEQDLTEIGGSSSAQCGETVPDDVQLLCGCHFHWQVGNLFIYFRHRLMSKILTIAVS